MVKNIEQIVNKSLSKEEKTLLNQLKNEDPSTHAKLLSALVTGRLDLVGQYIGGWAAENPKEAGKLAAELGINLALMYPGTGLGVKGLSWLASKVIPKSQAKQAIQAGIKFMSMKDEAFLRRYVMKRSKDLGMNADEIARLNNSSADDLLKFFEYDRANNPRAYLETVEQLSRKYPQSLKRNINDKKSAVFEVQDKKIIDDLRSSSEDAAKIAKELGIKKSETKNFMNFLGEFATLLKNSPNYIWKQFADHPISAAMNVGLSIYDIYQAYKENGNSLKLGPNVARVGGQILPGNGMMKLIYGQLGYIGTSKLQRAAMRKQMTNKEQSEDIKRDVQLGIYKEGLSEDFNEFETGQSGIKYHVLNNKAYDFTTGKPVNVQTFLADVKAKDVFDQQNIIDRQQQLNADFQAAQNAAAQGQDVSALLSSLNQQQQVLNNQAASIRRDMSIYEDDYNDDEDLTEQYYNREYLPKIEAARAEREKAKVQAMQMYQQEYGKVQQQMRDAIERYYTPEVRQMAYYQHMQKAMIGQAPPMTPQQLDNYLMADAMFKLEGQIQQQAISNINSLMQYDKDLQTLEKDYAKIYEDQRHNISGEQTDRFEAKETRRHNMSTEDVDRYKAITNAENQVVQNMISAQNAQTNQQRAQAYQRLTDSQIELNNLRQGLVPYQQASYMSNIYSNLGNYGFGGGDPEEFFSQGDPQLLGPMFPGKYQVNQPGDI